MTSSLSLCLRPTTIPLWKGICVDKDGKFQSVIDTWEPPPLFSQDPRDYWTVTASQLLPSKGLRWPIHEDELKLVPVEKDTYYVSIKVYTMPARKTGFVKRMRDAVDEWNERKEDAENGRRNKYGLKTALWYEEEEKRKERSRRHRHHRHRRDSSRSRSREGGNHQEPNPEEFMMSGANDDASGEGRNRGEPEGEDLVTAADKSPRRHRRRHRSRSRGRSEGDHRDHGRHENRSRSRGNGEEGASGRRRRTRGEMESHVEILGPAEGGLYQERHPQTDGAGDRDDRHRWQGPRGKPPRHPKMKPYDDGGFVDLFKAIAANLKEERAAKAREMNKSKRTYGRDKDLSRRLARERKEKERRARKPAPGELTPAPPDGPLDDPVEEPENPRTSRSASPVQSGDEVEPPVDPATDAEHTQVEELETEGDSPRDTAVEAERRQQEEMDTEQAGNASQATEVGDATASHHSRKEDEDHAPGSSHSSISTMPPEDEIEPPSNPPGSTPNAPASAGASVASPPSNQGSVAPSNLGPPHRARRATVETDPEGTESRYSGDESDHTAASTQATVPSSNAPLSSRSSPPSRGRGRRGRHSGIRGGSGHVEGNGDDIYNLHEAYDDEYANGQYDNPSADPWQFADIVDELYEPTNDNDNSHDQAQNGTLPPNVWPRGRPNGMPQYFNPPTGHAAWYAEGFQEEHPRMVWLPSARAYVTVAEYNRATARPPAQTRFSASRHADWENFNQVPQGYDPRKDTQLPYSGYRPNGTGDAYGWYQQPRDGYSSRRPEKRSPPRTSQGHDRYAPSREKPQSEDGSGSEAESESGSNVSRRPSLSEGSEGSNGERRKKGTRKQNNKENNMKSKKKQPSS